MSKKSSRKSNKARMAYVRSFIGKKRGKKGGSLKDTMDYVRSFRGKKGKGRKSGGRFPKGNPSVWRSKAKSGSAKEKAKYKRALDNWNKLMSKPGFKEKWNKNKIRKGGSLEENINYRQLINMYKGGAIPGYGYGKRCNGGAIRGYGIRGYGLSPALLGARARQTMKRGGGIRGYGYVPGTGLMTPKIAKKFEQIYAKHVKKGAGITKRDLYRGGARQNSLFFTRNRLLKKQRRKPMTVMTPDDEMVQNYRNLYKYSGVRRENMVDPLVQNDRLGGNVFKKIGNAVAKPVNFVRKHKIASKAAAFIPGPMGIAARMGAKALGAGLIEEAGLNGRGHPPYIYHG